MPYNSKSKRCNRCSRTAEKVNCKQMVKKKFFFFFFSVFICDNTVQTPEELQGEVTLVIVKQLHSTFT